MQFGRGSRRSIRYSIFIGVLAGTVFSGSVTYAADWESLSSAIIAGGEVILEENGIYVAPETSESSTYFGSFSGTLNGKGASITGLIAPLFNQLQSGSQISDLTLTTKPYTTAVMSDDGISLLPPADGGLIGQGVLANAAEFSTIISL